MVEITINKDCDECSECIFTCPMKIFEKQNNKVVASHPEKCNECHACEVACHKKAIDIND